MALIRVFELPMEYSNDYLFGGGRPLMFTQVDWFRHDEDDGVDLPKLGTAEGRELLTWFIRGKRYFKADRAYLVLHPQHPFTIGYDAP